MPYKKLIDGFHLFQKEYTSSEKGAYYKKLIGREQKPETLVIACSDSRIDPAILTHSDPGEFFGIRNVAALVPPYNNAGLLRGTSSAIEYAVRHLEIKHIVILGHEGCGGVNALATGNYQATSNHNYQFLHHWLDIGAKAKEEVSHKLHDAQDEVKTRALEQATILVSMENLLSFPWIKDKCDREELQIHGWYFDKSEGQLLEYNAKNELFEKVGDSEAAPFFLKDKPNLNTFLKNYMQNCACRTKS
ncbi:MAG: carbonic anhydrase [Micavibrio sp.]|nr:MAG: carbonic anhydrase [Micavibrio sp.]